MKNTTTGAGNEPPKRGRGRPRKAQDGNGAAGAAHQPGNGKAADDYDPIQDNEGDEGDEGGAQRAAYERMKARTESDEYRKRMEEKVAAHQREQARAAEENQHNPHWVQFRADYLKMYPTANDGMVDSAWQKAMPLIVAVRSARAEALGAPAYGDKTNRLLPGLLPPVYENWIACMCTTHGCDPGLHATGFNATFAGPLHSTVMMVLNPNGGRPSVFNAFCVFGGVTGVNKSGPLEDVGHFANDRDLKIVDRGKAKGRVSRRHVLTTGSLESLAEIMGVNEGLQFNLLVDEFHNFITASGAHHAQHGYELLEAFLLALMDGKRWVKATKTAGEVDIDNLHAVLVMTTVLDKLREWPHFARAIRSGLFARILFCVGTLANSWPKARDRADVLFPDAETKLREVLDVLYELRHIEVRWTKESAACWDDYCGDITKLRVDLALVDEQDATSAFLAKYEKHVGLHIGLRQLIAFAQEVIKLRERLHGEGAMPKVDTSLPGAGVLPSMKQMVDAGLLREGGPRPGLKGQGSVGVLDIDVRAVHDGMEFFVEYLLPMQEYFNDTALGTDEVDTHVKGLYMRVMASDVPLTSLARSELVGSNGPKALRTNARQGVERLREQVLQRAADMGLLAQVPASRDGYGAGLMAFAKFDVKWLEARAANPGDIDWAKGAYKTKMQGITDMREQFKAKRERGNL